MDTEKSLRLELEQAQADLAEAVRKGDAAQLRAINDTLAAMLAAMKATPAPAPAPPAAAPLPAPIVQAHNHVTVKPADVVVMPNQQASGWRHVPRYGKKGEVLEIITTRIQPEETP